MLIDQRYYRWAETDPYVGTVAVALSAWLAGSSIHPGIWSLAAVQGLVVLVSFCSNRTLERS